MVILLALFFSSFSLFLVWHSNQAKKPGMLELPGLRQLHEAVAVSNGTWNQEDYLRLYSNASCFEAPCVLGLSAELAYSTNCLHCKFFGILGISVMNRQVMFADNCSKHFLPLQKRKKKEKKTLQCRSYLFKRKTERHICLQHTLQ